MAPSLQDLRERARRWLADDPDSVTRAELEQLLGRAGQATADAELGDRFGAELEFGTAGLRGVLGAGPNRMNRIVVARATQALCAYLIESIPNARERGLVLGYDGRRMSDAFAREVIEVAAGAGVRIHAFSSPVPTPLVAFGVLDRKAAGGIVVTASHNPPEYNGYKVYWGNGAQIIPPVDKHVAERIAKIPSYASIARKTHDNAVKEGFVLPVGDELIERYLSAILALQRHPETPRKLRIAYTALHGVGDRFVHEAFTRAGFTDLHSVAEQAKPDGEFPTVAFPNPEEKGAMDRVLALATKEHVDLVLANDPDADRLAVAVPDGKGTYVQLTGNEVGALLGHYLLSNGARDPRRLVVCSIVSSPMLGAIAAHHGARWEQTLTGFKWIANTAMDLERETGAQFVFGYEEALGYTVSTVVRDKDGVGSALVFADFAADCAARGKSVLEELEQAFRLYGLFSSRQVSITMKGTEGAAAIRALMQKARARTPTDIAGHRVTTFDDLQAQTRRNADGTKSPIALPPSDALALALDGGHRIMLRPSGTEPKIKLYFDVRIELGASEPLAAAQARAMGLLDTLITAFRAQLGA